VLTRFIAFRVRLKTPCAIYSKLITLFHPPYLCLGELDGIGGVGTDMPQMNSNWVCVHIVGVPFSGLSTSRPCLRFI
jgi:hypothetical protein